MKAAAGIIVPFLLAVFIAVITTPLLLGMQKRGIPAGIALLILILALVVLTTVGTVAIVKSLTDLVKELPQYQTALQEKTIEALQWLKSKGVEAPEKEILKVLNPQAAIKVLGNTASAMSALLGNIFLIVLIAIFMLLEAAALPAKLRELPSKSSVLSDRMPQMVDNLRHYMGLKTVMSAITGVLVTIWVAVLGISSPLIMGLLAFVLNYIPNIGSIIAAIPAVILALVMLGVGKAVLCAIGYIAINMLIGNFLEPRVMGKGLGLSPMIVVITMVFWGWVLGPVGMLLSVPLTMTVKIVLDSFEETEWIAVLLGSSPGSAKKSDSDGPATDTKSGA